MVLKIPPLPGKSEDGGAKKPRDLTDMALADLLALRAQIDTCLPMRRLKDCNIEEELVLQLLTVQELQRTVLSDDDTPVAARAATAGQAASTLATLARLQIDVYTSERIKRIEQILVDLLKELPIETQTAFLGTYERELGRA